MEPKIENILKEIFCHWLGELVYYKNLDRQKIRLTSPVEYEGSAVAGELCQERAHMM